MALRRILEIGSIVVIALVVLVFVLGMLRVTNCFCYNLGQLMGPHNKIGLEFVHRSGVISVDRVEVCFVRGCCKCHWPFFLHPREWQWPFK